MWYISDNYHHKNTTNAWCYSPAVSHSNLWPQKLRNQTWSGKSHFCNTDMEKSDQFFNFQEEQQSFNWILLFGQPVQRALLPFRHNTGRLSKSEIHTYLKKSVNILRSCNVTWTKFQALLCHQSNHVRRQIKHKSDECKENSPPKFQAIGIILQ